MTTLIAVMTPRPPQKPDPRGAFEAVRAHAGRFSPAAISAAMARVARAASA